MELREMIEKVEHAESEIYALLSEVRERRGFSAEAKKLDTLIGKLENLKWTLVDRQRRG